MNNLPPGCTSDDGGIDHALESALERLCDNILTPEEADLLLNLLLLIRESYNSELSA